MQTIQEKVEQLKNEGYNFSISKVLSESVDLYKMHFGLFFGFFIVYIICAAVASFILSLIPYGIGRIILQIAIAPLSVGAFYVIHRIKNNREFAFENFFDGYKDFKKVMIYTLLYFLMVLPAFSPAIAYIAYKVYHGFDLNILSDQMAMAEFIRSGEFFVMYGMIILFSLGAMYVAFCFQFANMLILFLGVDYGDAFKWSFAISNKKFFKLFACHVVLVLVSMLGAILCGIGVFLTIPIVYFGIYILFYTIFDVGNIDHPMRDKIHDYLSDSSTDPTTEEMFR